RAGANWALLRTLEPPKQRWTELRKLRCSFGALTATHSDWQPANAHRAIGHCNHCTGAKSLFDIRPHVFQQCRERAGVETFLSYAHHGRDGFTTGRQQGVEIRVESDADTLFSSSALKDICVVCTAHTDFRHMDE